jgi:hypothetical protein
VWFKPAGTSVCLRDFSDFPAGTDVSLPACHGFLVGDEIEFAQESGGKLDGGITTAIPLSGEVSGPFVITSIDSSANTFTFATKAAPGTGVTLDGDGGTGSADNPLPAHINVRLVDYAVVCQVRSVSLDLSRETLDTTSLPCGTSAVSCEAAFRTTQPGYASGTGTMEVMFSSGQGSLANRLLADSLKSTQDGAYVKLYLNTVNDGSGGVDETASMSIAGPVSLLGFSISITPGEVTTATVNFSFSGQPTIDLETA